MASSDFLNFFCLFASWLVGSGAQSCVELLEIWKSVDDLSSVGRVVRLVIGERSGQRRPNVVDVIDGIVLKVQAFETGQLDKQIDVLPSGQVVMVEPELFELLQMTNVLDSLDLIVGQIENAQILQLIQTFDLLQTVVAHVELFQVDQSIQILQLRYSVGLNAQNGEIAQVEVLDLSDLVLAII